MEKEGLVEILLFAGWSVNCVTLRTNVTAAGIRPVSVGTIRRNGAAAFTENAVWRNILTAAGNVVIFPAIMICSIRRRMM
jgi:hypothetical protein